MSSSAEILQMTDDIQTYGHNARLHEYGLGPLPLFERKSANTSIEPASPDKQFSKRPEQQKRKSFRDVPFQRTVSFPIEKLPGALPFTHVDPAVDHVTIAETCVARLNSFRSDIFTENAIWRDI